VDYQPMQRRGIHRDVPAGRAAGAHVLADIRGVNIQTRRGT
jgi:hypothetical protein